MKNLRVLGCIALVVLLSSCGGSMPPMRSITVVATDMAFTPNRIEAKVGEQVFLTLDNKDSQDHNLVIEFPTGTRTVSAQMGVSAVLAFPARDAGTYTFYCSIPGHEAQRGVLVITP